MFVVLAEEERDGEGGGGGGGGELWEELRRGGRGGR